MWPKGRGAAHFLETAFEGPDWGGSEQRPGVPLGRLFLCLAPPVPFETEDLSHPQDTVVLSTCLLEDNQDAPHPLPPPPSSPRPSPAALQRAEDPLA